MKAIYKLLVMLLVVSMLTVSLASCDAVNKLLGKDDGTSDNAGDAGNGTGTDTGSGSTEKEELPPLVDYASQVKLDQTSTRKRI